MFHASLLSPYVETDAHGPNYSRPPPDLIGGEEFTKWSRYETTDIMDALECYNISSNGREAPKVTTPGNQLIKSLLQTY